MKPSRVLVLMHESLVPPASLEGLSDKEIDEFRTEYDVTDAWTILTEIAGELSTTRRRDDEVVVRVGSIYAVSERVKVDVAVDARLIESDNRFSEADKTNCHFRVPPVTPRLRTRIARARALADRSRLS